MDPKTLAKVLRLPIRPTCYPAKIIGYSCKLWGSYPALVDNPPGAIVHGVAYEVQSPEEVTCLQAYETDNYRPRGCLIEFEDGREVAGKAFVWNADKSLLKEGVFDLKNWQMEKLD